MPAALAAALLLPIAYAAYSEESKLSRAHMFWLPGEDSNLQLTP